MISNRCARKSLLINCNSIISKNYLRFLVGIMILFQILYRRIQKTTLYPIEGNKLCFFLQLTKETEKSTIFVYTNSSKI